MNLSLDPLRPYADLIKFIAALLLVALLIGLGWYAGAGKWQRKYDASVQAHAREIAAHKATKANHAAKLDQLANATQAVAARAKAATETAKHARAAADKRYQEALDAAKREADDLRTALRRGEQRLHERWSCDSPGATAGGSAGGAGKADAQGRYDSTARIVGAADDDAAVIAWLWDGWMSDRQAVIAAGCAVEAPR